MKTKDFVILTFAVFSITACGHQHQWTEATCTEPAKCSECGEIQGEALGHTWVDATCTEPKTCSVCGVTEGEALGHTWVDATCTEPKTCSVCGATEGSAKGHEWKDATCTEAKTCIVCGEKNGEPLGHDTPNLTCTTSDVCTRCEAKIEAPGHTWVDATCTEPKKCSVCGTTEGEALGHTTTNGICDYCGKEFHELISGKGDDVVNKIGLKEGNYKIHIVFSGKNYKKITVNLIDKDNISNELLDTYGEYDGTVLLSSKGKNPYTIEVLAEGTWSIQIENIETSNAGEFSGKGDTITSEFKGPSGTWEFTHDGKSEFKVTLHIGEKVTELLDTHGKYNGRANVKIPEGENAFFEIIADGNWTAKPMG